MNKPIYVPILKWKKGEQDAIKALSNEIKDSIIPLIEIQPNCDEDSYVTHMSNNWNNRFYYFDVEQEFLEIDNEIYWKLLNKSNKDYVIPTVLLDDELEIIVDINTYSKNGIAIRIFENDADEIEKKLEEISSKINPNNIDLIIDLHFIDETNYSSKKFFAKTFIGQIPKVKSYRNVIISSSSFPQALTEIDKNAINLLERLEYTLWKDCYKKWISNNIELIYSDYCINHPDYFKFIPGMKPSFNIRYTTNDNFIIIKGEMVEKGGLNINNVTPLCKLLVDSKYFLGADYSWGDDYIYKRSIDGAKEGPGNLTNWRTVGTNHHITLVINQLSSFL